MLVPTEIIAVSQLSWKDQRDAICVNYTITTQSIDFLDAVQRELIEDQRIGLSIICND